ncbi:MAG TPA: asparaginase domain-containing protein [Xanthomonadales bacterium]|nr:asparaginase domain-containing protein [Xanthomonadales bacterium]
MQIQHVHILKMGGTIEFIDPAYDEINKKLLKLDSSIESYLKSIIKPHFNYSTESIVEKDSREITQEDREKLAKIINSTPHQNIIITHGTFTMRETALFLEQKSFDDKKIILTGSMIPLSGFSTSDAGFNLGYVVASFTGIEPGVYLSMNGGIFTSSEVEKNVDLFRFE